MSIYKKNNIDRIKKKAIELYKTGLSTRAVAQLVGRSHNWVALLMKSTPVDN